MKEKLVKILGLPKSERGGAVSGLQGEDLKAFCEALLDQAKIQKLNLGINGLLIKKEGQEVRAATAILNQFPEVRLEEHSSYKEFDNQAEKLDAIIEGINNGKFLLSRAHELIHENYFEHDSHIKTYHTFLSYAASKLEANKLKKVCKRVELLLGEEQYCKYLELEVSNGLMSGNVFSLYLDDNGFNNEQERKELSEDSRDFLNSLKLDLFETRNPEIIPQGEIRANADTHAASNHKSADESHVAAFKMMIEGANLDVEAEYVKPVKEGDRPREVKITVKGKLDDFVKQKLSELQKVVTTAADGADEYIYNTYLRYNDSKKFTAIEHKDLTSQDKAAFDKKIKGFRFQAKAAKRYLDDMANHHWCGPHMPYNTNTPSTCGLTMEQMIAAEYFACDDKKNFESNKGVDLRHIPTLNRILLIAQIYDMKRGINIDNGQDKPEEFEFPSSPGDDVNRCLGGGINSLAGALKANHKAYEINTITRADIVREIKNFYTIIINENVEALKDPMHADSLINWNITGSIGGSIKREITDIFNEKYLVQFTENFKGYVPDDTFYGIIKNGFNNIKVPTSLISVNNLANLNAETLLKMIMEEKLPLLVLDKEQGYISTLRYLLERHWKENIAEEIINRLGFEEVKNEETQKAINYLCKSGLNEDIGSRVLFRYRNHDLTISDLKAFSISNIVALCMNDEIDIFESVKKGDVDLLRFCLESEFICKDDLKAKDELNRTPLHCAVNCDNNEAVLEILKHAEGRETLLVAAKYGETPLLFAVRKQNKEVVLEFLKHEEGREALLLTNIGGETPLLHAACDGNKEIVQEILKLDEGRKTMLILNNSGLTPLHWAALGGHKEIVQEFLKLDEGQKSLLIIDEVGRTPLHCAVQVGNKEIVLEFLKHKDGRKALLIRGEPRGTPLHWAALWFRNEIMQEFLKLDEGQKVLSTTTESGRTALYYAARSGNKELAELLIKNGADISEIGWYEYFNSKAAKLLNCVGLKSELQIYTNNHRVHVGYNSTLQPIVLVGTALLAAILAVSSVYQNKNNKRER